MKPTDFSRHIGYFFKVYLPSDRNVSLKTIESYSGTFSSFLKFMQQHKSISADKIELKDFTGDNILNYLRFLEAKGNCANTINQRRAAFCSFCKYLRYEEPELTTEINAICSIESKYFVRKTISYMKVDGMNLFLKQIDLTKPDGLRDMVMMSLMLTAGIRVSELISLKGRDVQLSPPVTIKVLGKGRKERLLTLPDKIVQYLTQFIKKRNLDLPENMENYLFISHMNKPFTRHGVNYIVAKYRDMARKISPNIIPADLSCHKLRHSCGAAAAEAGVDAVYIRDLFGHSSVATTNVYMGTKSPACKSEAINKIVDRLIDGADDVKPLWANEDIMAFLEDLSRG